MLGYMALQLAFMGGVPHDLLNNGWSSLNFHSPLMNLALLLGLNFLVLLLTADSVVSPSGTGYAYLGGSARMFYAMAMEGQMPRWTITKLNPIYNLCRRSLLINWTLVALVLWNSKSWASLMLVVTGYHVIGYMAAPVSMGAIKPKTRFAGCLVFIILAFVMNTLPHHNLALMNVSIMILMFLYGIIQLTKKVNIGVLFVLISPFIIFLWLLYACSQNLVLLGVIAAVFYFFITSARFVEFCRRHKGEESPLNLDEDFGH
jgi:amino acid transporter